MTAPGGTTDWRLLREFAGVDLTQSFVLSWDYEAETLSIDIDLYLTADHAFYEAPRPAQKVCIRPAVIEFRLCESMHVSGAEGDNDPAIVAGGLAHGAIAEFHRLADGHYEISGEFGTVRIDAERPILRIEAP